MIQHDIGIYIYIYIVLLIQQRQWKAGCFMFGRFGIIFLFLLL